MGYKKFSIFSKRYLPLLAGLLGGIGGMCGDADHILSKIMGRENLWGILHQDIVVFILAGLVIALFIRLLYPLLLRRE